MYKVRYSEAAKRDLEQIGDYIMTELSNPQAALGTVRKIQNSIDRLCTFPEIGSPLSSIADTISDYRFLVCGNYLTFYRLLGSDIMVDRIINGKRDYMKILFGNACDD